MKNMAILLMCCALTACGWRSPPPDYYVLAPLASDMQAAPSPTLALEKNAPGVLLRKISLPAYLEREALVLRKGQEVRLVVAQSALWAEALDSALPRLLEESMRPVVQQKGLDITWENANPSPVILVDVTILRFDGNPGHKVWLDARWRMLDRNENLLAQGVVGRNSEAGENNAEMVQALGQLGVELGRDLADAAIMAYARMKEKDPNIRRN